MGQVASVLGCGESRNGDAELAQAPISSRGRSSARKEELADLEVILGDELSVPEQLRLLPGRYFKHSRHNKRECYRKEKGNVFIYWACDSWWFSTEIDGLVSIAMADCQDNNALCSKVPSKGWQIPKTMFSPPSNIPLSVQVPSSDETVVEEVVHIVSSLEEELKHKLSREVDCCRAGCSAFMVDLMNQSPPALKSCLGSLQEKYYPSMRTNAERLKDLRAEDVKAVIKESSTAVKGAVQEIGKIARSASQEFLQASKAHVSEKYERSKATAANTGELVRKKSRDLREFVQDKHSQYYPVLKEEATTLYGTAADAKETVKRKGSELSEAISAKSSDARVIVRSNTRELKEKGCRGALDKLAAAAVALCEAILPHEEDLVSGSTRAKRDDTAKVPAAQPEAAADLSEGQYALQITRSTSAATPSMMIIKRLDGGSEEIVAGDRR